MKTRIARAILLTLSTSVFADEVSQTDERIHQLPELMVTASLWESELSRATASVTAFDGEQFNQTGTQHFHDLVNAIPNLTWTGGSSRPRYLQIRGVGENSQFEGETPDSSIRFMVDDLDFTGLGTIGNLFDIQQVEVLRGPQVGAFGVNAAGGLIKLTSYEPTAYWTGQAEATVGQDDLIGGGLAFGGPLLQHDPEILTFRFSTYQLKSDGFRINKHLGRDDTNARDEFNSRLKLRWKPSSDWTWDGTIFYANADNGYDEWSLNNTEFTVYSDQPGRDEQASTALSLRGTWEGLASAKLSTITAYANTDSFYSYDGDWGAGTTATAASKSFYTDELALERDRKVFSQEIRLDAEKTSATCIIDRWTLGFYTQGLDETGRANWTGGGYKWNTRFESEAYSVFGQVGKTLSPESRLSLQLRGEYYKVKVGADGIGPDAAYAPVVAFDYTLEHSELLWGGTLTFEHDFNSSTMGFLSLSKGYKAGGASTPNFTKSQTIKYKAETLWTAEAGLRKQFFAETLSTGLTAFYTYRDKAQFRDSSGAGSFFDYITVNGKSAKHYGIETDASWNLNSNWKLGASLGLLKASREAYGSSESRDVANAPNYTYSVRLDYEKENGFFANATLSGSDAYYESNSHNEKRSSFAIVNGALGYRLNNWTLTVWGRNLFDTQFEKRVFYFDNTYDGNKERYESPNDPQQFGATLNYVW